MSDATNNLVIEHLRSMRGSIDRLTEEVSAVKLRMGNVETQLGHVHSVLAEQSVRVDRLGDRVERIEKRLELVS